MSVQSDEMKRSTLQRKDREELTSIAMALGGKPSSRARKAELVDLILELADGGAAVSDEVTDDSEPVVEPEVVAEESETEVEPSTDDQSSGPAPSNDGTAGDDDPGKPDQGNRRRRRRGRDREKQGSDEEWAGEPTLVEGFLDLRDEGYGFLRVNGFMPSREDAYVSVKQVRQFGLRRGDQIIGGARPANRNEKNAALHQIDSVNGAEPESVRDRPEFADLTAISPHESLTLERPGESDALASRVIDLVAPIGKGQRGLIEAAPGAGVTTLITEIARSIEANNPEVHLIVLTIDERPEEITGLQQSLARGEVAATTFDRPADEHVAAAELTMERAKRMVESGRDVCVIVDGLTRLTRAYNQLGPGSGRVGSAGIDYGATQATKRFVGAARNVEDSGSLTMLATIAVGTGIEADRVIFEELRPTANMTLRLDASAARKGLFPAIDVAASSTRNAVSIVGDDGAAGRAALRDEIADDDNDVVLKALLNRLEADSTNAALLAKATK